MKLSRKENIVQALKFLAFSASAGIIQILSFTLFFELCGFFYNLSYVISLVLSVLYNFTVNRSFTFKSAKNVPLAMLQIFLYYLVFTPLSTWWSDALTKTEINEYVILFGTMVINFVTEFLFSRFVVYRKSINTNALAKKQQAKRR